MKPTELATGLPGHPTHPPLTDAVIGLYTGAAAFALLGALGLSEENMVVAWWYALVAGLVVTAPTALTGLLDWLKITRGTPLWKTATAHLVATAAAVVFLAAALVGYGAYDDREITTLPLALTLAAFALLTLGGWLGGSIVYVYGMRVLREKDKPAHEAAKPDASDDSPPQRRAGLTRVGGEDA